MCMQCRDASRFTGEAAGQVKVAGECSQRVQAAQQQARAVYASALSLPCSRLRFAIKLVLLRFNLFIYSLLTFPVSRDFGHNCSAGPCSTRRNTSQASQPPVQPSASAAIC